MVRPGTRRRYRRTHPSSLISSYWASSSGLHNSSFVTKLQLILAASARDQIRWARQHLYAWLVLGPIVVGLSYFTATRVAQNLELESLPGSFAIAASYAIIAGLIGFSLSRASAEIYHLHRPEAYLDALPV